MPVTEQEKRAFHSRRAALALVGALEMDEENSKAFSRSVEHLHADVLYRVLDTFEALSEAAAYGARCYFDTSTTLTFEGGWKTVPLSEKDLTSPMELADFAAGFETDGDMLTISSYIMSSIDRISSLMERTGDPQVSERAIENQNRLLVGALVQSHILDATMDDPFLDDAPLMDDLEWLADHADELKPFINTLRIRSYEDVLDIHLCRELISNARDGASPILSEGVL